MNKVSEERAIQIVDVHLKKISDDAEDNIYTPPIYNDVIDIVFELLQLRKQEDGYALLLKSTKLKMGRGYTQR